MARWHDNSEHLRHRYLWAVIYGAVLVGAATYVLLDTFVIEHVESSVATTSTSAQSLSTASGTTATAGTTTDGSSDATVTDTSYSDDNIQISITTLTVDDTQVYVADVQVSDASYLRCALAQGSYGRNIKETTSAMASENNAILAINGDYYGFRDTGYVVRNGTLYRSTAASDTDALVIASDGTMYAADQDDVTAQSLVDGGAWQVLSFGPVLVSDGQVAVDEDTEVDQAKTSNPRTAIGMISPLHYVMVVSDGRTSQSSGLSLYQLAQVLRDQGCTFAYNLDGGGSTTMVFNGTVVNNPTDGNTEGERKVSDIVYVG
ncbi:MAG: phosphodiester glycosidase family protein [Atopobiaceae bacterium]|jgi:exopolysaccharide biosynthesis protein|nr:phosphodiester glycosidase family protein [Atopobiaceae bacterium]MCH4180845.1 phosphodiester glycosidase family protein [Atopobiaceae bacterium]MCH4213482.1 phosphodiester glycosidase family protein [Atopobiaceae bacterium]MCH4230418.1 phosphodiester glycosidase family protein [Atopobiaceae bacterium]MCH4277151.1 phosphodiester glycosidase family protein [Atopobiaceae bacterium]